MEAKYVSRADRVKGILDGLIKEITAGGAVAYMQDKVRRFDDGAKIPMRSWSLCNQMIAFFHGTRDARTFSAWKEAGRFPKKGSHAFQIVAPLFRTEKDEATDEEKRILSGFTLINEFRIEDTEGEALPYQTRMRELRIDRLPLIDVAEKLGIKVRADLCGSAEGSFSPSERVIRMNCADKQVFLHELSHGIIAEIKRKEKASLEYAFEEICAELSSAFLGSLCGTEIDIQNTKAYIQGWAGKGHVAWKVIEAVDWVEKIWRFIEEIRQKSRKEEKDMGIIPAKTAAKSAKASNVLPFRTEDFKDRTQIYNPKIGKWVKRDARTGLFTSVKGDGKPFSRVKIEENPFAEVAKRFPEGDDLPPAA
ncbi:MAG: hypothetical protein II837_03780 [Treponema sp.]|nr:hypothetical protein [Treponema sp.]